MSLPFGGPSRPAVGPRARAGRRLSRLMTVAVGLGLAAAAMAGCTKSASVQGRPIAAEAVARIVDGQTTEAEIREWFGPTSDVVVTNTGKVLTYQYKKEAGGVLSLSVLGIGGGVSSGQLLIVTLDEKGTVVRHAYFGGP